MVVVIEFAPGVPDAVETHAVPFHPRTSPLFIVGRATPLSSPDFVYAVDDPFANAMSAVYCAFDNGVMPVSGSPLPSTTLKSESAVKPAICFDSKA